MQTVVSLLTAKGQNHTTPHSLLKSYEIKSINLTFSLTRGASSTKITNGRTEKIDMKVVNKNLFYKT